MTLLQKIAKTIQSHDMIRPGERVLVAVSGGPDSVAMTQVLFELCRNGSLPSCELVLAHLNHQLRVESDQDEAFCHRFASELGCEFVSDRVDVQGESRRQKCSLEEAGRWARYRFLEAAARQKGCRRIAVGHTRNDQAETFLLRLLQGAGTTGLGAIRPVSRGKLVIRPLIEVKREELLEFLGSCRLAYRTDHTNLDCSIPRNWVRHRALPFLETRFNPALIDSLARTTDLLREEEEWMDGQARSALEQMSKTEHGGRTRLPVGQLSGLPLALARRVVRLAVTGVKGDLRGWRSRHVDQVLELTSPGKSGRFLALPGIECFRSFNDLWIFHRSGRVGPEHSPQDGYNEYEYELPVPGRLEIPEAGGAIETRESRAGSLPPAAGASVIVGVPEVLDGDVGLVVRSPRAGDRFRNLGAPGSKSLSRYLMEQRVDRRERRRIPLVVRGEDEVLWVVGHGVSELSRVGPGQSRKLHLTWVKG